MNKQLLEQFKRGEVILYTPTFEDFKAFVRYYEKEGKILVGVINLTDKQLREIYNSYNHMSIGLAMYSDSTFNFIGKSVKTRANIKNITVKDLEPDKQEFTKDDLKVGMIIEIRNGTRFLFLNNTMIKQTGSYSMNVWYDDLTCANGDKGFEVIKIFKPDIIRLENIFEYCDESTIIWERDAVDWSQVVIDTKILVKDFKGNWLKRYFAGYKNGKIYTWSEGSTSFSTEKPYLKNYYSEAKLYKEDK